MPLPTPLRAQGFSLLLLFWTTGSAPADTATNEMFAARAEKEFARAQQELAAHPGEAEAAWRLGRASFDWADLATNAAQRAARAQVGIAACQQLLAHDLRSAPGHYYLAMNFGQLAEAEAPSLAAYKRVREIEREFKTAAELDEKFDYAGPARCLGLLYRNAPTWPLSIGSKHKAHEWLDRAAALAPDYPENQLHLAESHVRWHQALEAESALLRLEALWPAARTNFVGEAWEPSWQDWTARRAAVRAEFQKTFKRPPALP